MTEIKRYAQVEIINLIEQAGNELRAVLFLSFIDIHACKYIVYLFGHLAHLVGIEQLLGVKFKRHIERILHNSDRAPPLGASTA